MQPRQRHARHETAELSRVSVLPVPNVGVSSPPSPGMFPRRCSRKLEAEGTSSRVHSPRISPAPTQNHIGSVEAAAAAPSSPAIYFGGMREEGEIVQTASAVAKGVVKIEIMDTGIGISKAGIARLFQRYQQADPAISQYACRIEMRVNRTYGGTGLGLWISRSILHRMGGEINVKSKLGVGSNMILAFPTQSCPEVPLVTPGSSKTLGRYRDVLKGFILPSVRSPSYRTHLHPRRRCP